jgi:ribosomal protein S18 acetylase RimI-like enzyme
MALGVTIRPATESEIDWCARLMAGNDPWLTYRCSVEWCRNVLNWPGSSLYIAVAEETVGFILLHQKGFLGSPYIAAVIVAEEFRGNEIGSTMLKFAEQAFSGARHAYLCVSSFNYRGLQLYQRHGYVRIGELQDFIADGFSEILMSKQLH